MRAVEITSTLDCKGLACPLPVIKLSKAIKGAVPGAVIELLATDPGAVADLEVFERRSGHRVLEWSESNGIFRFLVQRANRAGPGERPGPSTGRTTGGGRDDERAP